MRRNSIQTSDLESNILNRVRACNGISRVDVARELGLAPSTAGVYVERLIADGFLTESEKADRKAGRPPRLLRLNPSGGEFIGVDFEARNIMAVAVDFADRPQRNAHRLIEEDDSVEKILQKIIEAITEVLPKNSSRLLAIGVGVPGIADSARGVAVAYKYLSNWRDVPLAARLRKKFKIPVFLENNVRSMALAELWFGQGRGQRDFLCVGIRSGISVGLVLDGRLHRGSKFGAGELGRWLSPKMPGPLKDWFPNGAKGNGFEPELQEIASVRAILNALKRAIAGGQKTILKKVGSSLAFVDIIHAVQQRDGLTILVIEAAAKALGSAIGNLSLVLDPSRIILAGPLTLLGDTFAGPVQAAAAEVMSSAGVQVPEITNSTMGEFSGALGAAALALHQWKPSRRFPSEVEAKSRQR